MQRGARVSFAVTTEEGQRRLCGFVLLQKDSRTLLAVQPTSVKAAYSLTLSSGEQVGVTWVNTESLTGGHRDSHSTRGFSSFKCQEVADLLTAGNIDLEAEVYQSPAESSESMGAEDVLAMIKVMGKDFKTDLDSQTGTRLGKEQNRSCHI